MAARAQASRHPAAPAAQRHWGWFISGSILGALVIVALHLGGLIALPTPAGKDVAVAETTGPGTAAPQQEFQFWTRLKESEVVAPNVPEYESSPRAGTTADSVYVLQAGAFRSRRDADSLRAELILLGLDVQIEKITTTQGDTWHRVQAGPYTSRRDLNTARNRLTQAGIESLPLQRKPGGD